MDIEIDENIKIVPFESLNTGDVFIMYGKIYIKINDSAIMNAFNLTDTVISTVNSNILTEPVDATLVIGKK